MPEISRFDGIVIRMFFKPKEHEPAHIHAFYGERVGIFDINTHMMLEGDLPANVRERVVKWLMQHEAELMDMWRTQNIYRLPPL